MRRVLRSNGRLTLSVVARKAATQSLEPTRAAFVGDGARRLFDEPFVLAEPNQVSALVEATGFRTDDVTRRPVTGRCQDVEGFVEFTLTTRLASEIAKLSPDRRQALLHQARFRLAGVLIGVERTFPIELIAVLARPESNSRLG